MQIHRHLFLKPFVLINLALILGLGTITAPSGLQAAPKRAALVIDAQTGKTLYSQSAHSPRHPASLTKVMTLYVLFEFLKAGRLTLDSQMVVTEHASSQQPSKLGLKPGSTISVRNAIKALTVKSANDVAVTVAENLAGSEWKFAQVMTWKARKLGMHKTRFYNASGLPHAKQITTAYDMSRLGLAIQRDFPEYYSFFSVKHFSYRGKTYKSHNGLLFRYGGTDGIKTGYTRASGFNLISSVRRGRKHIIGVVLGGKSARHRNARMRRIITASWRKARKGRTAHEVLLAAKQKPKVWASPDFAIAGTELARKKRAPQRHVARLEAAKPQSKLQPSTAPQVGFQNNQRRVVQLANPPDRSKPVITAALETPRFDKNGLTSKINLLGGPALQQQTQPASNPNNEEQGSTNDSTETVLNDYQVQPGPYHIQIGAFNSKQSANQRLKLAQQSAGKILDGHNSFTMAVPDNATLIRARFAGFSEWKAKRTCRLLKRKRINCMALPVN